MAGSFKKEKGDMVKANSKYNPLTQQSTLPGLHLGNLFYQFHPPSASSTVLQYDFEHLLSPFPGAVGGVRFSHAMIAAPHISGGTRETVVYKLGKKYYFRLLYLAGLAALAGLVVLLVVAPEEMRRRASALLTERTEDPAVLATGGPKGAYYRLGALLSSAVAEQGQSRLELLSTAGSMENIDKLQGGKADFAFIQGGLGADLSGLAAVANLGPEYVHLLVPADSSIQRFRDLTGKRVGIGPEDSGFEILARRVFDFEAFSPAPQLVNHDNGELEQAFLDGRIDAAFTVYGLFAPAMEEILGSGWYRLLPIAESEAIARFLPGVTPSQLPCGLYGPNRSLPPDCETLFPTMQVDTLLVTRKDTLKSPVRDVLDVLYRTEFLQKARLGRLTEERSRQVREIALHEAAERFYARNDPVSSDKFEIASFFLAGMVGVFSLTHYVLNHRVLYQTRKRRRTIIPYFETMLEFGQAVSETNDPDVLAELVDDLMAVQRDAEKAWLAGDLETEHMENLYAVFNIRSRNAFSKIMKLQMKTLLAMESNIEAKSVALTHSINEPVTLSGEKEQSEEYASAEATPAFEQDDEIGNEEPPEPASAHIRSKESDVRADLQIRLDCEDDEDSDDDSQLTLF
jgi:TRAP transporter TAXI family solute receptor